MASKHYLAGDPEVGKFWSKRVAVEAMANTQIAKFLGQDGNSLGVIEPDTEKGGGDQVVINLRMQLTGDGVGETESQEGNEEEIVTFTDTVTINELSHAVSRKKGISDQRVPWDVGMQANDGLADWSSVRMDRICFNHLCGYSLETRGKYTGWNTINAPSAGRQIWSEAGTTDDAGLDSSGDEFSLKLVDYAREVAETGGSAGLPPIRPCKVKGVGDVYVCFLHPTQVTQLRTTSGSQWQDIYNRMLSGKEDSKNNPLFTGALGMYNNTVFHSSRFIRNGISNAGAEVTTVKRAVFCGAQALALAFGKGYGPDEWKVTEELFDYKRRVGQSLQNIFGVKATRFNSSDFGKIVISTYATDAV